MRVLAILFFILGISQLVIFAQTSPKKSGCPVFSIVAPDSAADSNKPLVFRLDIDRKINPNEKLIWTTSAGKILSGQGTESIAVENVSETGETITATIDILGLPDNCEKSFSASAPTVCPIPLMPMKMDEFGKATKEVLKEKIVFLSQKLKEDPTATASIIKYSARRADKLDAYRDLQLMLNYLKSDGIDEERINFQIGFEEGETTELWFVPAGAAQPPSELLNTKPEILDAAQLRRKIASLSKKQ